MDGHTGCARSGRHYKEVRMAKSFNLGGYRPIILSAVSLVWSLWTTPLRLDDLAVTRCLST